MTKQIKITLQDEAFEKLEKLSSENYLSISYFLNRTIMEYWEKKLTQETISILNKILLDNKKEYE